MPLPWGASPARRPESRGGAGRDLLVAIGLGTWSASLLVLPAARLPLMPPAAQGRGAVFPAGHDATRILCRNRRAPTGPGPLAHDAGRPGPWGGNGRTSRGSPGRLRRARGPDRPRPRRPRGGSDLGSGPGHRFRFLAASGSPGGPRCRVQPGARDFEVRMTIATLDELRSLAARWVLWWPCGSYRCPVGGSPPPTPKRDVGASQPSGTPCGAGWRSPPSAGIPHLPHRDIPLVSPRWSRLAERHADRRCPGGHGGRAGGDRHRRLAARPDRRARRYTIAVALIGMVSLLVMRAAGRGRSTCTCTTSPPSPCWRRSATGAPVCGRRRGDGRPPSPGAELRHALGGSSPTAASFARVPAPRRHRRARDRRPDRADGRAGEPVRPVGPRPLPRSRGRVSETERGGPGPGRAGGPRTEEPAG